MTDQQVIAAIRANHLKANIRHYDGADGWTLHWDQARVDPGGTIFGDGPYVKLPVSFVCLDGIRDDFVIRVYAPARLRRRLAKQWTPA